MKDRSTADHGLASRVRGLMTGSFLGDALGGPIEFQHPDAVKQLATPPHHWGLDEVFDARAAKEALARFTLRGYDPLRPTPEPFGHWTRHARPGTVTDDSRHKMILLAALRAAVAAGTRLDAAVLARAYLDWPRTPAVERSPEKQALCADWLEEWQPAARWVLGERNPDRARPPERLWGGLATCCGQMILLPLAALHPGRPEAAYLHAYELAFFDNGPARDLNAGLVAGLAWVLGQPATGSEGPDFWDRMLEVMRATDPHRYGEVPWVQRPLDRWLDFVEETLAAAKGRPGRVFARLDAAFGEAIKWEAQVCFSVAVAALLLARSEPLAALPLSLEWGHDTDSYAQLVGAFLGARFGEEVFPAEMREVVRGRVIEDYGFDLQAEADQLAAHPPSHRTAGSA